MFAILEKVLDIQKRECYSVYSSRYGTQKGGELRKMKYNYAKLRGLIREKLKTEGAFAQAIGRSHNFVSLVFNGEAFFTQKDIAKAVEVLEINAVDIGTYFFAVEVHETELQE